jgi:release factor glutamine methyltransferase
MHPENYPIEYIDGKVTFFSRDFVVTPDVLIPRLETECLVRRARTILQWKPKTIVVDIGCGSGIIGTSIADLADEVIFLDISPEALAVTETNFRTHFPEKRAQFIVSDLLDKLPLQREYREAGRDLVSEKKSPLPPFTKGVTTLFLTNLPYIRSEDWIHMSADTVNEPRLALFGWEQTGFEMYERLFAQIAGLQLAHFQILCEFGFDQREIAEDILKKYPQWQSSFFADYAGIERFGEVALIDSTTPYPEV